jgi:putative flippase GtrA
MIRFRQWLRYGTVSVVSSVVSLSVLGALVFTGAVGAAWANVISTAVGTVPSFELNRRWVWGKTGRRSLRTEIGPFCALSFAGLGLSTVAVAIVSRWAAHAGFDAGMRTLLVELANVGAFGSLWIAQFLILDRLTFRAQPERELEVV